MKMQRNKSEFLSYLRMRRAALLEEITTLDNAVASIDRLTLPTTAAAFDASTDTPSKKRGGWKWTKAQRDRHSRKMKRVAKRLAQEK